MLEFQLNDMKREDEERARAEEKQSEKLIAEILKSEGFDVGEQDEQGSQAEVRVSFFLICNHKLLLRQLSKKISFFKLCQIIWRRKLNLRMKIVKK